MRPRPPPIRTSQENAFAHHSMRVRVPVIVRDVAEQNPDYPPAVLGAIEQLAAAVEQGQPLPPATLPAPDGGGFRRALARRPGEGWLDTEWYFAESYLYRTLMLAARYWQTGRDPFAPRKAEEVASPALWERLEGALALAALPFGERVAMLLRESLWGNRMDLSYAVAAAHGRALLPDDLIADASSAVAEHLARSAPGPFEIHVVTDNAGTELALDLALAGALLEAPGASVLLHVKMHPTFVSDAVPADVMSFLAALRASPRPAPRALGVLLARAFDEGRLGVHPDFYWNSSRFFWSMPARIREALSPARLVIVKGDANYRRLLGDALWAPETPFEQVCAYFPAPLVALRTLKSDPLVGLKAGLSARLEREDPAFRVNGRRGVIQARLV